MTTVMCLTTENTKLIILLIFRNEALDLQSWTNYFGTLAFISVPYTFSDLRCLPPLPLINVGHQLVHFQSCTLFLICFPQTTLNGGEGVAKEPRMCEND